MFLYSLLNVYLWFNKNKERCWNRIDEYVREYVQWLLYVKQCYVQHFNKIYVEKIQTMCLFGG